MGKRHTFLLGAASLISSQNRMRSTLSTSALFPSIQRRAIAAEFTLTHFTSITAAVGALLCFC